MSRDALGDARPQDAPSSPPPVELDAEDEAPNGPGGHPPPREGRRRVVATAAVAAALVLGGLVGHRAGSSPDPASSASAVAASQVPRPSGYAVSLPDEEDPRATRVVVSWAGARDLAPDRALVVAVVVDDRTRVGRTRLGDPGGGTGGDEGRARPAADEVARAVLREAGEDPAAEQGVAVTAVTGRVSGVLVVDVHEDGPDLGVVTAPRVHLAVVEGAKVLHQLALPVGSRRVRS